MLDSAKILDQVKQHENWLKSQPESVEREFRKRKSPVLSNYINPSGNIEQKDHPGVYNQSSNHKEVSSSVVYVLGNRLTGIHDTETTEAPRALNAEDLYRSYKHTPHSPVSVFLKYLVHRHNHLDEYNDPNKGHRLDVSFRDLVQGGGAADKNGHISIEDLHKWVKLHSGTILPELFKMKNDLHAAVKKGVGVNVREINGEPHIALARGIGSEIMNREHPISSHADVPETGFGSTQHHAWVNLKDVWFSYDHGPAYCSGNMGPEEEWLVSNKYPRYQATPEDVKPTKFKNHFSLKDLVFDSDTDEQLADQILPVTDLISWGTLYNKKLRFIFQHPNAGTKVYHKVKNVLYSGGDLTAEDYKFKWVPREDALKFIEKRGVRVPPLKNPNLTSEDLLKLSPYVMERDDPDMTDAWAEHPQMNSKVMEQSFDLQAEGDPSTHVARHQAKIQLLSHPLVSPSILQKVIENLSKQAPSEERTQEDADRNRIIFNIAQNPNHTPEQAQAIYNIAKKHIKWLDEATIHQMGKSLKLPESVIRDPEIERMGISSEGWGDLADSPNLFNIFVTKNPNAAPVISKLFAENDPRIDAETLKERSHNLGKVDSELQSPFIQKVFQSINSLHLEGNPDVSDPVVNEKIGKYFRLIGGLDRLADRPNLTQETINALANYPTNLPAKDILFRNKSVTPEQLKEAYPKSLPFPEPAIPGGWAVKPSGDYNADQIAEAYYKRKLWEERLKNEHIIKPLPQNLAKSESKLWAIRVNDWLAQQKSDEYYYPTTHAKALNIMRDQAITPDTTDELLEGRAIFAHRATPTFIDEWRRTAKEGDVLLCFLTKVKPQKHKDAFLWLKSIPVDGAHIIDVADVALEKIQSPISFPQLGLGSYDIC